MTFPILTSTWRYKLDHDYVNTFPHLEGIYYKGDYLEIYDSKITIPKGYAWDGCTPTYKVNLPKIFPTNLYIGPWDGPKGEDGLPTMFYPSLVHDALCQYRAGIEKLKKKNTVELFRHTSQLAKSPRSMTAAYCFFIDRFGPQEWLGDKK